jgi:hypothetical protein
MDALAKLKADLLAELNVQYKNLIAFLQNAPLNLQFKNYAYQNLDQGIMWIQKAIELIQPPKAEEPASPGEAITDDVKVKDEIKPEVLN